MGKSVKNIPKPKGIKPQSVLPKPKITTLPGVTLNVNTAFDRDREDFSAHFKFHSVYPWFTCVKVNSFTNYCRDADELSKSMVMWVHSMVPYIYKHSQDVFINGRFNHTPLNHSHKVPRDKTGLVLKIAREVTKLDFDSELNWWQLGGVGSERVVGVYDHTVPAFYPVFIDRYHLIHESQKYNDKDYKNYSYEV